MRYFELTRHFSPCSIGRLFSFVLITSKKHLDSLLLFTCVEVPSSVNIQHFHRSSFAVVLTAVRPSTSIRIFKPCLLSGSTYSWKAVTLLPEFLWNELDDTLIWAEVGGGSVSARPTFLCRFYSTDSFSPDRPHVSRCWFHLINLLAHSPNAKRVLETIYMIVYLLFFTCYDSKIPQNQPDRQRFVYESMRGETTDTLHAYVSPDETGVRLCSAPEKQTGAQAAQLLPWIPTLQKMGQSRRTKNLRCLPVPQVVRKGKGNFLKGGRVPSTWHDLKVFILLFFCE